MKRLSNILHWFFGLTVIIQLAAILYISTVFVNPKVAVHFSFYGSADGFGDINDYFILIGVNVLVYIISLICAKFVRKTNPQQFEVFNNEDEKEKATVKIKLFTQILSINFSIFVTWLIYDVFQNVLNSNDFDLEAWPLIIFIFFTVIIIIMGCVWIFKSK